MFYFKVVIVYTISIFIFAWSRSGNLLIRKTRKYTPWKWIQIQKWEHAEHARNTLVTRSDSTVLTRTRLRWSDNFCPPQVVVTTIATRPKRAWSSPLGLNFTGVQCRPWSNGAIVILMDPWRPILRCYYDFVQWLILWECVECATGYEEIIWMSSFYQVVKSEWEPELYLCVHLSKFRNALGGESG